MRIAIAGRPGSGKSALFDLLASGCGMAAGAGAAAPGKQRPVSGRDDPAHLRKRGVRIAHVGIPDPRLLRLSAAYRPRKTTPARLQVEDLEQPSAPAYPALSPERREMLAQSDLILLVLDLFSEQEADPVESALLQWNQAVDEFLLIDLSVVESRLEKLRKLLRIGQKPNFPGELELLEAIHASLESGQGVLQMGLDDERTMRVRGFHFLSARPVLAVCNLDEGLPVASGDLAAGLRRALHGGHPLMFSAEVERQILDLPDHERDSFMALYGQESPALEQVIRSVYEVAGLVSFFTVGDDEVRAWSVRRAASAVEAAGAIHSDLARGFVAAEVMSYADWETHGSYEAGRARGACRLEGKGYSVRDGDLIQIRSGLAKAGR